MANNARHIEAAGRRGYATPGQVARYIRAMRDEGVNPSSFKMSTDGSILISTLVDAGEARSDFDVWNAAGKL